VDAGRLVEAAAALSTEGLAADAEPEGWLRFPLASDDEMVRAIRAIVLAGVAVYEARVSAELEELFEKNA